MGIGRDLRIEAIRTASGVRVPALKFECRQCGRVLKPGEGSRRCPECGSADIALVHDPDTVIEIQCAA